MYDVVRRLHVQFKLSGHRALSRAADIRHRQPGSYLSCSPSQSTVTTSFKRSFRNASYNFRMPQDVEDFALGNSTDAGLSQNDRASEERFSAMDHSEATSPQPRVNPFLRFAFEGSPRKSNIVSQVSCIIYILTLSCDSAGQVIQDSAVPVKQE